jgi:hypothetical protein
MSNLESMISRYRELESIAINAPDAITRNEVVDERINLAVLIAKEKAVDASQAIAEMAGNDPQEQFSRQDARIRADAVHRAKVDAALAAYTEAGNALAKIPMGDTQARDAATTRMLSLRLQLEKLQTIKGSA